MALTRTPKKKRKRRPPRHEDIVLAHLRLLKEIDIPSCMANTTCWACHRELHSTKPERAHIESFKSGGSDLPQNYLLLCHFCHINQPDGASKQYQLRWLKCRPQFWEQRFEMNPFQSEFERMAPIKLEDFCAILLEEHGEQGIATVFKRTIKQGSLQKAGMTSGNIMANSVAALVELYHTRYAARHSI